MSKKNLRKVESDLKYLSKTTVTISGILSSIDVLSDFIQAQWSKMKKIYSKFQLFHSTEKSFVPIENKFSKKKDFFSWGCTDKTNEKPAGSGILFDSLASVGEQFLAKLLYRSHTGRHHKQSLQP